MASPERDPAPEPAALLQAVGWPAPVSASPITGGWDTLMWRVAMPDGSSHALRVYRPHPGFDMRAVRGREIAALQAARAAGLPAPSVEESGELGDYVMLLLQWMPGVPLATAVQRRPWSVWTLGRAFGSLQARLHRAPAPDALRPPTQTIWTRRIRDAALADAVARRAVTDTFCHMDFHPLNVLARGGRITALLDFVNATVADRCADLGVTNALLVVAAGPPGMPAALLLVARRLLRAGWRSGYRAEAGEFPLTPLYEAWGTAYHLASLEDAVREGRGWATAEDVARVKRFIEAKKRAAGVPG